MCTTLRNDWNTMYGTIVESDHSVSCTKCDNTLIGDGPAIEIECLDCFVDSRRNGLILSDAVVCSCCAGKYETGIPVSAITHPDGYTCDDCGEIISSIA